MPLPGGCDLGSRPIDQHIKCFEALGAKTDIKHGIVDLSADRLIGTQIYFDKVTVGGTINALLACAKAEGLTIIENAAKEPHICYQGERRFTASRHRVFGYPRPDRSGNVYGGCGGYLR